MTIGKVLSHCTPSFRRRRCPSSWLAAAEGADMMMLLLLPLLLLLLLVADGRAGNSCPPSPSSDRDIRRARWKVLRHRHRPRPGSIDWPR